MAYITLDEAKRFLRVTGVSDDTLISELINHAQGIIDGYLGRTLESATYTETFVVMKNDSIPNLFFLTYRPVTAVTSVKQNGTELNSNQYTVYASQGVLVVEGLPAPTDEIEITYTAGYTTIPEDIKFVTKSLVAKMYAMSKSGGVEVSSERAGDWAVSFKDQELLDPSLTKILDRYKNAVSSPKK